MPTYPLSTAISDATSAVPNTHSGHHAEERAAINDLDARVTAVGGSYYNIALYDVGAGPNDNAKAQANSDAFRKAMAAAWQAGGGTVYFPPGIWYMQPNTGVGDTTGKAVAQAYGDDGTGVGGLYGGEACGVLLPNCGVELALGATAKLVNGYGLGKTTGSVREMFSTVGREASQAATSRHWIIGRGKIDGNAPNTHTDLISFHGVYFTRCTNAWLEDVEIVDCVGTSMSGNGESFAFKGLQANVIRVERVRCYVSSATGARANGMSGGITFTSMTEAVVIDCVVHDTHPSGSTSGGHGFSHFDSNYVTYTNCFTYGALGKGFNFEGGRDVTYIGCRSGVRTSSSSSQPLGANTTYGSGSAGAGSVGIGFLCNTSAAGVQTLSSVRYIGCQAVGTDDTSNKGLALQTTALGTYSSSTATTITASDSPFGSGMVGADVMICDSASPYTARGPWVKITGFTDANNVTVAYNPFAGLTVGDKIVIKMMDVEWVNGDFSYNYNAIDSNSGSAPEKRYQACTLKLANTRFDNNINADVNALGPLGSGQKILNGVPTLFNGTAVDTAPAVPATGILYYNPYPCNVMVYVNSNGATFTANGIQVRGKGANPNLDSTAESNLMTAVVAATPTTTQLTPIKLLQGHAIVLNYSAGTPTWTWVMDMGN